MILRPSAGFTVIEILFLVALTSILMAIAIPSIRHSTAYYELTGSVNQLATELNAARMLAISRGAIYTMSFDSAEGTFQVVDEADPENFPRAEKTLDSGVTFKSLPQNSIRFFSRGNARGGVMELQNELGEVMSVEVHASGRIETKKVTQ
ncbi:MAG: GspH/FimT family pseudopilin [Acidobacteria bacterium]|nr:GspH/FimT family pseudopilin [Acidobacteriota bacterium]